MALLTLEVNVPDASPIGLIAPQMCALADKLNVIVQTKHKSITVFAGPGDVPSEIVTKYMNASFNGRKLALVNSKS